MKISSSRCRTFEYRVTRASPCAVDLAPSEIGVTKPFFDCLLLGVGVQRGDRVITAAAVEIVKSIVAPTGSVYIVIDGFAHWAEVTEQLGSAPEFDVLAGLADALDVLAELTERLEERGELVHLMPFGWNNVQRVELFDGQWPRQITDIQLDSSPAWSSLRRPDRRLTPRVRMPCGRN